MNKLNLIILFCACCHLFVSGQQDVKDIKSCITNFASAGDKHDVQLLERHLDDNYRVVMNRLFGSKEIAVLSKEIYLSKIKSKEFGGDKRQVIFQDVLVNGPTATAKVEFKGQKMTLVSLITLVKNEEGSWKLISDIPIVS